MYMTMCPKCISFGIVITDNTFLWDDCMNWIWSWVISYCHTNLKQAYLRLLSKVKSLWLLQKCIFWGVLVQYDRLYFSVGPVEAEIPTPLFYTILACLFIETDQKRSISTFLSISTFSINSHTQQNSQKLL